MHTKQTSFWTRQRWSLAVVTVIAWSIATSAMANVVDCDTSQPGRVTIRVDGEPVAEYVFRDDEIARPYFTHVRAPGGLQVTRNHPPLPEQDLTDHPTFHPGVWMSFGDISGADYWRLKARTEHAGFVDLPLASQNQVSFTVHNRYLKADDVEQTICNETCSIKFRVHPQGYLLLWDSTFSAPNEFYFGDQEEMGLGFRVATPLRAEVKSRKEPQVPSGNGSIVDAAGHTNEKQVWGQSAAWCNYSGTLLGKRAGIALFCHPKNLRPSWFHARDRGYVVANLFGRSAMGHGEPSRLTVLPGEKLRLRYGLLLHSGAIGSQPDLATAFDDYVVLSDK